MSSNPNTYGKKSRAGFNLIVGLVALAGAAHLGYLAGVRQASLVPGAPPKTYILNLGSARLVLSVGAMGILVTILLTILLATAVILALVASHRRKRAEAAKDEIHRLNTNLERRVDEQTEQLRESNRQLDSFAYSVAHDLRAPLRHICGFSKLLEDDSGELLNAAGRQHLQMIQKSGKNMGELIDGLLNMGRIWRQELAYEPTDLNTLIQSVLRDLQPDNSERHIEWHIGELSTVKCDPGLVRQVFANLVSNAVKYTRRRDHAVIEIGELIIEGRSVIFVRDNGAGFDQQYVHKLFGPFQRLHTADEFEGNGVGLATIQSIIRRHGGRIWAEGQVDKGATFFFELLPSSQGEARAEPYFALKVTQ